MSKIDEKYIDALSTFTFSLEQIVETLKEQQKANNSDTVNDFLKAPMDNLVEVVKELKKVTIKGFAKVNTDNKEILKKIESIKQQRESGMFDRVEDPRNKNKIIDGIKVVVLIAAGVLALGMAFKIIGKVDFLSVMALSGAMLAMSVAFNKIGDIKGLTYGSVFRLALILPVMAAGLALSGYILQSFPQFTLLQGLSIILIGGALGIATNLLLGSVNKIGFSSLIKAVLIPLLLPLVAFGIAKASYFLKDVQKVSVSQVISIGLIGIALGVATYGIGLALKGMKNVTWKEMLALPIMLPLIAGAIVLSSQIFQDFIPIKKPLDLLKGSLVIGIAVLAMSFSVVLLGRLLKGNLKELTIGVLGSIAVAGAIVAISYAFQALTTVNAPDFMWTLKTGLALLLFSSVVVLIALAMNTTLSIGVTGGSISGSLGGDIKKLGIGILAIIGIAASIVAVSQIFRLFAAGPIVDPLWALGVGLSILILSAPVLLLGVLISSGIGLPVFLLGLLALPLVAASMIAVSKILSLGNWTDNFPSSEWALGVGGSLLLFSIATIAAAGAGVAGLIGSFFTGGEDPLVRIAQSMVDISFVIQAGKWDGNYPQKDWALGVGTALILFATATIVAAGVGLAGLVGSFFTGGEDPLLTLTKSMVDVSWLIQTGKWDENYPQKEWALGVGTALALFAAATVVSAGVGLATSIISFFTSDKDPLLTLAKSMVEISWLIQTGKWNENYPKYDWAFGVGTAMALFAAITVVAGGSGLAKKIFNFFGGDKDPLLSLAQSMLSIDKIFGQGDFTKYPSLDWTTNIIKSLNAFSNIDVKAKSIRNLADSFRDLSDSLKDVNSFDNLSKISSGLVLLSVIDDAKLQIVLDKIKENENTLKTIYGDNSSGILNFMERMAQPVQATIAPESILSLKATTDDIEVKKTNNKLDDISNKLSQLLDAMNQPTQAGSFNK